MSRPASKQGRPEGGRAKTPAGAPGFNCADQSSPTWIERADRCVDLIETITAAVPPPIRLADLGCGDQKLRQRLERRSVPAEYRGFDLKPQGPDVVRYDITADPPPPAVDVFTILGVVEYLHDVRRAIERLGPACRYLVVSHVVSNRSAYSAADLQRLGWVTHMTEDGFADLLRRSGFVIERTAVTLEGPIVLWLCRSTARPPAP